MQWYHEVSPAWLEARQEVVTATDLVELRKGFTKLTKAQKEGREFAPSFMALWGKKHLTGPQDPASWNDAARGHFMEPYAVHDFSDRIEEQYFHWDDCVVCCDGLGFSPDAMDVKQPIPFLPRLDVTNDGLVDFNGKKVSALPRKILEVKSYDVPAHMKAIATPAEQLPERWQVAGAFMVLPSLEEAYVVFYCPKTWMGIGYKRYTRDDLEKEVKELSEILDIWDKQCKLIDKYQDCMMVTDFTEQQIEKDFADFMDQGVLRFR